MCGIAGIVGAPAQDERLSIMIRRMSHRGPDGRGTWRDDKVALGHLRLKIIDVSDNAAQPMIDPTSGNVLIFNGEIYNYLELKQQLGSKYRFRTSSDTETILAAYAEWGPECTSHLRGMFAFALWDAQRQRMFLARDRFGIKPLYYREAPGCFVFASEIKALHRLPGLSEGVNALKVMEFICARQLDTTAETMFQEIHQIPPSHYAWVGRDGRRSNFLRYWEVPRIGNKTFMREDRGSIREKLMETVSLHLRSDVSVGAFVSGGLDSSSLACIAGELLGRGKLHTFSSVLAQKTEENALIPHVQGKVGGIDHAIQLDGDSFLEDLPEVIYHHDEPLADGSMYAHFELCKLARHYGVPVLLSGNGGDEVFGGYATHIYAHLGSLLKSGAMGSLRKAVKRLASNRTESASSLWLRALHEALPISFRRFHKHLQFQKFVKHVDLGVSVRELPFYFSDAKDPFTANYVNNLCHWTVPPFLHYEDRNAMAFGVEVRVPMLDHKLVEHMAEYSPAALVGGMTKWTLRESMRGIVPAPILDQRGKYGFAAPLDVFLHRRPRETLDRYESLIRNVPFFDRRKAVEIAQNYYRAGLASTPDGSIFWRTFSIAIWYERFFVQRWQDSEMPVDPTFYTQNP